MPVIHHNEVTQACRNSLYLDNGRAVWTKRHLRGLLWAFLGAPVPASSAVDGGGGFEGYFQIPIAFFYK